MESTFEALKNFNPWISIKFVRDSVFFYFQSLMYKREKDLDKGQRMIEQIFGLEDSSKVITPYPSSLPYFYLCREYFESLSSQKSFKDLTLKSTNLFRETFNIIFNHSRAFIELHSFNLVSTIRLTLVLLASEA